jgi:hypothetical protein
MMIVPRLRHELGLKLMTKRSMVILTIDGLATSGLSPYGCSWLETPGMDRLASQAIVFDRLYAVSNDPRVVLSRYLAAEDGTGCVAELATQLGMPTLFFTDSPDIIDLPAVNRFDQCTLIDAIEATGASAPGSKIESEIENTAFGRLLASALARRETLGDTPHLVWIHASSLLRHWDAPESLRESDDLDFESIEESEADQLEDLRSALLADVPRDLRLSEDDHPDLLLAWMAAYGGQIRVIDTLIEVLFDALEDEPETMLAVASTCGFALGENGWIGPSAGPPRSSRLHLPMIIKAPEFEPIRCGRPSTSDGFSASIACWLRGEANAVGLLAQTDPQAWAEPLDPLDPILEIADDLGVDQASSETGSEKIRISPGWLAVDRADGGSELYLKPDDRYDANDVATLRPEIVAWFRDSVPVN